MFVFQKLSEMKKAHDDLVASLKEEHGDEIAELDSKHSSAIDGKLIVSYPSVCTFSKSLRLIELINKTSNVLHVFL